MLMRNATLQQAQLDQTPASRKHRWESTGLLYRCGKIPAACRCNVESAAQLPSGHTSQRPGTHSRASHSLSSFVKSSVCRRLNITCCQFIVRKNDLIKAARQVDVVTTGIFSPRGLRSPCSTPATRTTTAQSTARASSNTPTWAPSGHTPARHASNRHTPEKAILSTTCNLLAFYEICRTEKCPQLRNRKGRPTGQPFFCRSRMARQFYRPRYCLNRGVISTT